jgi:uncharacterized membrane protein (DUF485 family)
MTTIEPVFASRRALRFNAAADRSTSEGAALHSSAPDPPSESDSSNGWSHNARLGLALFVVYLLLYGGFVGLATFAPNAMAKPALAGVNLAVVYGFGLIVAALVLALVYMVLCRAEAPAASAGADAEGGR